MRLASVTAIKIRNLTYINTVAFGRKDRKKFLLCNAMSDKRFTTATAFWCLTSPCTLGTHIHSISCGVKEICHKNILKNWTEALTDSTS